MNPKLTIGLLVYNHEKYILDCLNGIMNQSRKDVEIIILNDASEDNTDSIIRSNIKQLERNFGSVKYINHEKNCGNISKNVNEIISYATGEYFWGISGDDMFCAYAFEEMINILDMHKECDIVYANMIMVENDYHYGDKISSSWFINDQKEGIQENLFKRILFRNCIPAPSTALRKNVFEKYGLHDESIFYEDYEYWLRVSKYVKFYFNNRPLVLYRRSYDSVTVYSSSNGKEKLLKMMKAEYATKKKYIGSVSEEYKKLCLMEFYNTYYKECVSLFYQDGIRWIEEKMKEDQIQPDEKLSNYNDISEKLWEENEILVNWGIKKKDRNYLSRYFKKRSISSIAIYGYSRLGKLFESEIADTAIQLKCIVDQKGDMIQASVPVFSNLLDIDVDAIIVAPRGIYYDILNFPMLKKEIKVIDIGDIFKED